MASKPDTGITSKHWKAGVAGRLTLSWARVTPSSPLQPEFSVLSKSLCGFKQLFYLISSLSHSYPFGYACGVIRSIKVISRHWLDKFYQIKQGHSRPSVDQTTLIWSCTYQEPIPKCIPPAIISKNPSIIWQFITTSNGTTQPKHCHLLPSYILSVFDSSYHSHVLF